MTLQEVDVAALDPERLEALIGPERAARFEANAMHARTLLEGRRVVNISSTATGGGVAELLHTLLAYVRGVGVDARWLVIEGSPDFFKITKRIHNHLYGSPGDGGPLGPEEHARYERTLHDQAGELSSFIRADDIVMLHDPQTAGLAGAARTTAAQVVWRCHVGRDVQNHASEVGWEFLRRYLEPVDAFVFTRAEFAPSWIDRRRLHVITPSIDPFCAKNELLAPSAAQAILQYVGLLSGDGDAEIATFRRRDGSPGRVDRRVDLLQTGPPPPPETPLVVQVSRWDRIKDMQGVLVAFAEHVDRAFGAHLMLVGPAVHGVTDDPEGGEVLDECVAAWRALPQSVRTRVHLACVPMHDPDEAAVIVNALQRHATVVTQKSLAEGFGLTVVEAMWKHRPVVATRVGGIVDQITHDATGLLVDDPWDFLDFGRAINRLLGDKELAARIGEAAHERAHRDFLGDSHLGHYGALFASLLSTGDGR
jgi:trehalose synthase